MPRNVRPAWIDVRTDGRSSTVGTGPQARTGKMDATVSLRINGSPEKAMEVFAGGINGGTSSFVRVTTLRGATIQTPDGTAYNVPAGTMLTIEAVQ